MTTVADLATRVATETAYLFVAQGLPFMFTDHDDLVGSGASSWIGTGYGPRRVLTGLDLSGQSISYATEMGDGRPDTGDGLTVKIQDFDRELIALFAVQPDALPVGGRLGPKDDPAPTDLIGTNGDNVPIWGKWVNAEAIGPAGERSYYSLLPGGDDFGQDHAAYLGDLQTLAPSYVYATPTHLDGRRCALYRIFRNPDTGEWPTWSEQHASGYSLIWVGSMTSDANPVAIEWTIKCEGPSSWLRKQLGAQRPTEWLPVSGEITLSSEPGAREDLFALSFIYQQVSTNEIERGGVSLFDPALDFLPVTGNANDFRSAINDRIATVSATPGADITWTTDRNAEASLEDGYVETRIDDDAGAFTKAALWALGAHEKVWLALGYDPIAQRATNFDTDLEIKFLGGVESGIPGLPGPGYYVGHFWTVPVGFSSVSSAWSDADNGGKVRRTRAINPQDVVQIPPAAGFELSFGIGSPAYFEAQTNRAPVDHALSNTGGDCDAQGYVAFRGPYLEEAGGEARTMVQLAQVCWRNDSVTVGGDTIGLDSTNAARVFVSHLIDGRFHGIDRKPLDRVWATVGLEWCPVNFLGYAFGSGDYAHRTLLRLLLSTGTASWSGFEGAATLTPGANHPPALDGLEPYSDAEIADLGLGIPHALIDLQSFGKAAGSLPGGITSALNRCRYAWVGAQDSQELIATMLEPRGWGLGFNRGRWRLFSRPDVLTVADAEVVVGTGDIMGGPDFVESVNLQPMKPSERWKVDTSRALVSEAATEDRDLTVTARALDPASRSRRDNGETSMDGWGLVPIPLWRGEDPPSESDWRAAWGALFSVTMAAWCNAAHTMIPGLPVMPNVARQLGPGSVVRFSSYYAATREGVYGPTAKLGRVYKVEHDLESGAASIDVLLQPGDPQAARLFAPVALVLDDVATVEERHDAAARTFYCKADGFGHGEDLHDVAAFAEPAWLGVGGDAKVQGWQWNGRTMVQTFGFTVESVSTSGDSITYAVGSLTGAWVESQLTALVLAPYDDQPSDSWPRALFSVLTRPDFKFGGGPTQGFPLT